MTAMHALATLIFIAAIALSGYAIYDSLNTTLEDEEHWKDY